MSSRAQSRGLLCAFPALQIFALPPMRVPHISRRFPVGRCGRAFTLLFPQQKRDGEDPHGWLTRTFVEQEAQADPSTARLMNKLESALDEGSNVPHSSQTRLEWATLQFLDSDQSPRRRICSLPASRKAEGGGHPAPLVQPDRCVSHPLHPVLNLHRKQIARDDKYGAN